MQQKLRLKRLILAITLTTLTGISTGVNAWWGGPFGGWGPWDNNGWGNDWFGNGWFDFNMSFGGWGRGWGRGWDYYNPYWGNPYWGGYPYYGYYPYWGAPHWGYPYTVAPLAPQAPSEPTAPATSASK
jgi:hypothetical protein